MSVAPSIEMPNSNVVGWVPVTSHTFNIKCNKSQNSYASSTDPVRVRMSAINRNASANPRDGASTVKSERRSFSTGSCCPLFTDVDTRVGYDERPTTAGHVYDGAAGSNLLSLNGNGQSTWLKPGARLQAVTGACLMVPNGRRTRMLRTGPAGLHLN